MFLVLLILILILIENIISSNALASDSKTEWSVLSIPEIMVSPQKILFLKGVQGYLGYFWIESSEFSFLDKENFLHLGESLINTPLGAFSSSKGELSLSLQQLNLFNVRGSLKDFSYLCSSQKMSLFFYQRKMVLEEGVLTDCTKKSPDWGVYSQSIFFPFSSKKNKLIIKNPIIKVGKVPIFWLPKLSLSSRKKVLHNLSLEGDEYKGQSIVIKNHSFAHSVDDFFKFLFKKKYNSICSNDFRIQNEQEIKQSFFKKINFKNTLESKLSFYFKKGLVPSYKCSFYEKSSLWHIDVFAVIGGKPLSYSLKKIWNMAFQFNYLNLQPHSYWLSHYSYQTEDYLLYQIFRRHEYIQTPSPTSWVLYTQHFKEGILSLKLNYHLSAIEEKIKTTSKWIYKEKRSPLFRIQWHSFMLNPTLFNQKVYFFNQGYGALLEEGSNFGVYNTKDQYLLRSQASFDCPFYLDQEKKWTLGSSLRTKAYIISKEGEKEYLWSSEVYLNRRIQMSFAHSRLNVFFFPELSIQFSKRPSLTFKERIQSSDRYFLKDFLNSDHFLENNSFIKVSNYLRISFPFLSNSLRGYTHYFEYQIPLEGSNNSLYWKHHGFIDIHKVLLQYFMLNEVERFENHFYLSGKYKINSKSSLRLLYLRINSKKIPEDALKEEIKMSYLFDRKKYSGKIETIFTFRESSVKSQVFSLTKKFHCFHVTTHLAFSKKREKKMDWSIQFRVHKINF